MCRNRRFIVQGLGSQSSSRFSAQWSQSRGRVRNVHLPHRSIRPARGHKRAQEAEDIPEGHFYSQQARLKRRWRRRAAGGRVVPGFDGCWVKLDMATERRRSDTEQHGHEQHRAQSTEHRAQSAGRKRKKGTRTWTRSGARSAERRVWVYLYINIAITAIHK